MRLILDYETRSELKLPAVGPSKYSKHQSTEILCMGYKIENEPAKIWLPGQRLPSDFKEAYLDPSFKIVAHNSMFEFCITNHVLHKTTGIKRMPVEKYKCTMAKAAAHALPQSLEGAAEALKLKIKKNMDGRRLVLKYAKPRPQWSNSGVGNKWYDDELELASIYNYCRTDCDVEKLLDDSLPDLSPEEVVNWVINQKMNLRGVQIDTDSVKKILNMLKLETRILNQEVCDITDGAVDSVLKVEALTNWLQAEGVAIADLTKASVTNALKSEGLSGETKRVLEIRQQIAKASVKKFKAMMSRAEDDGKIRDLAKFHGASTGRETAQAVQVHNLPSRGLIKTTDHAIKLIQADDFDTLKLLYGNPFQVFSSCIRSVITASPGKILHVGDYNAIECRILNWLAGHEEILEDFRLGRDPYKKAASRILGKPIDKITDEERQFGKVSELASGYQMGPPKFLMTCEDWGVKGVTKELAARGIKIYRESHQPVVAMWSNVEKAAIRAVQDRVRVTVHKCTWYVEGAFLYCQLPSGRRIAYYGPSVRNEPTPWGEMAPKLYYWRSKNKKWFETATYGGKLVENKCQAIGRCVQVAGIQNTSKAGFDYLFQVHDENISEAEDKRVEEYQALMVKLPSWSKGLPIEAKAWAGFRYRK